MPPSREPTSVPAVVSVPTAPNTGRAVRRATPAEAPRATFFSSGTNFIA